MLALEIFLHLVVYYLFVVVVVVVVVVEVSYHPDSSQIVESGEVTVQVADGTVVHQMDQKRKVVGSVVLVPQASSTCLLYLVF